MNVGIGYLHVLNALVRDGSDCISVSQPRPISRISNYEASVSDRLLVSDRLKSR
jgi:hypothetical protein